MEVLSVRNLNFKYPQNKENTLSDINFSLEQGDFAVLHGATGCGKSTLLRMLKKELSPLGEKSGDIIYCGKKIEDTDSRESASEIGFVMQKPEQQIVTDKVWHELAFGLENLGISSEATASRIAEISCYFGIENWYEKRISELSGGQKQILILAAVMTMNPSLLILDEPTAQLDPVTASEFINTLHRINQDFSVTILLSEHRLDEALPYATRLLTMKEGRVTAVGKPREIAGNIKDKSLLKGMPVVSQLYHLLGEKGICPLTVREGRKMISRYKNDTQTLWNDEYTHSERKALELKQVYFRYERQLPDVISELDLTVYENEFYCILGGNGSGKTTALNMISGLLKAYSGKIRIFEKEIKKYKNQTLYRECLAMLPQDVQLLFLCNTVREELDDAGCRIDELPFDLPDLMEKHPYDLSGGQQQLLAFAKVLAQKPKLLLLDEPTKAIDAASKEKLAEVLLKLKSEGMTIVAVTHDVEFAAAYADRCSMFFRGKIVSEGVPQKFFSENNYYTTISGRITRDVYKNTVTTEETEKICRLNGLRENYD